MNPELLERMFCPAKKTPLAYSSADEALVSAESGSSYPVIGGVPVLVPKPQEYLHRTAIELEAHNQRRDQNMQIVKAFLSQETFRTPMLRSLHAALEQNVALSIAQRDALAARLDVAGLLRYVVDQGVKLADPRQTPAYYGPDLLSFVRADWSDEPAPSKQRSVVLERVNDNIARFCGANQSALVVGGGAGRYFHELAARFDYMLGSDLNFTYVDIYHRLKNGPMELADIFYPMISSDVVAESFVAALPDGKTPENAAYFVADALQLPVRDGTQDAVVSIYFSDCVPIMRLLNEARRVLKPGGVFISLGPMFYHSVDQTAWFTPTETLAIANQIGFDCEHDEWGELAYWSSPHRSSESIHRVWNYVLRRRD
ncbi:methyltransferase domain-containing protein [Haliangium ochraceum]|uniref:Methyltransferase type 11 n=1 Tax=Haliangium ochraceum (strain DSM 14365 / JCM 11303 / SMP-2) TaxID=502025 RepID=D0LUN3_HALO1|nr:methyltransferase domain-containing protein [Haliangium ochraceum]ACY13923.1 Methyltransferase type 11 [Haliangium ochraceum DSM 14365]